MNKHPVYGFLTQSEFQEMTNASPNRVMALKDLASKRQSAEFFRRKNSQKNRK